VLTFHLERDGGSLRLGDREWQTEAGDVHLIAPGEIADPSGWVFLDSCVLECTAREERSASAYFVRTRGRSKRTFREPLLLSREDQLGVFCTMGMAP
jgi:hypothetical protein